MNVDDRGTASRAAESANQPIVVYERGDGETPTEAVVAAVSSALEVSETEMEPIYRVVDPDALDSLFRSDDGGARPEFHGQVVFRYDDHRVRVDSAGTVFVY